MLSHLAALWRGRGGPAAVRAEEDGRRWRGREARSPTGVAEWTSFLLRTRLVEKVCRDMCGIAELLDGKAAACADGIIQEGLKQRRWSGLTLHVCW